MKKSKKAYNLYIKNLSGSWILNNSFKSKEKAEKASLYFKKIFVPTKIEEVEK